MSVSPASWFVFSTLRKLKRKLMAERAELARLRVNPNLIRRNWKDAGAVAAYVRQMHIEDAQDRDAASIAVLEKLDKQMDAFDKDAKILRAEVDRKFAGGEIEYERRHAIATAGRPRLQFRSVGGDAIRGHAAVFYVPGNSGTEFELASYPTRVVERIHKKAFDVTLRNDDIRASFNHDLSWILGRTSAGTLKLSVDSVGLRYSITPPSGPIARHVVDAVRRRDVTGSSFMFRIVEERVFEEGQQIVREILETKLYELGPVSIPAYDGASATV